MPKGTRLESGAQLLARLGTRPDLSTIDPYIFGKENAQNCAASSLQKTPQSTSMLRSTLGRLIEISGPEGVGKTELALYYVALTCLPELWNNIRLGGIGAKVVIVDSELKISVLRLAVIMEKLILELLQALHNSNSNTSLISAVVSKAAEHIPTSSETSQLFSTHNHSSSAHVMETLTPEDIEQIVQESLARVQVVKPSSVQQLYVTLLSLQQDLAFDLDVSLLVVDSVTAFFWEDQLAENAVRSLRGPSTSCFASNRPKRVTGAAGGMAQVAEVVSQFLNKLGINIIMTKSPLLGCNTTFIPSGSKRKRDSINAGKVKEGFEDEQDEFLGKAWHSLNPVRILLSNACSAPGKTSTVETDRRKVVEAMCSWWPKKRQFTFNDDELQFL